MIPLFLLNLVRGRKLIAWIIVGAIIAGVVGGIAWAGWTVKGWKADSAELVVVKPKLLAFEAAQKAANERVVKQQPIDEADVKELVETKATIDTQDQKVSRAAERVKPIKETTDETTGCPVVRLSDGYGVCLSAAAGGDRTDAQACETAGGDGPVATSPSS